MPVECSYCDKRFMDKHQRYLHQVAAHPVHKRREGRCFLCNAPFLDFFVFYDHFEESHALESAEIAHQSSSRSDRATGVITLAPFMLWPAYLEEPDTSMTMDEVLARNRKTNRDNGRESDSDEEANDEVQPSGSGMVAVSSPSLTEGFLDASRTEGIEESLFQQYEGSGGLDRKPLVNVLHIDDQIHIWKEVEGDSLNICKKRHQSMNPSEAKKSRGLFGCNPNQIGIVHSPCISMQSSSGTYTSLNDSVPLDTTIEPVMTSLPSSSSQLLPSSPCIDQPKQKKKRRSGDQSILQQLLAPTADPIHQFFTPTQEPIPMGYPIGLQQPPFHSSTFPSALQAHVQFGYPHIHTPVFHPMSPSFGFPPWMIAQNTLTPSPTGSTQSMYPQSLLPVPSTAPTLSSALLTPDGSMVDSAVSPAAERKEEKVALSPTDFIPEATIADVREMFQNGGEITIQFPPEWSEEQMREAIQTFQAIQDETAPKSLTSLSSAAGSSTEQQASSSSAEDDTPPSNQQVAPTAIPEQKKASSSSTILDENSPPSEIDKEYWNCNSESNSCPRCGGFFGFSSVSRGCHYAKHHFSVYFSMLQSKRNTWLAIQLGDEKEIDRNCPHCRADYGFTYCGRLKLAEHLKQHHPIKFRDLAKGYLELPEVKQSAQIALHTLLVSAGSEHQ